MDRRQGKVLRQRCLRVWQARMRGYCSCQREYTWLPLLLTRRPPKCEPMLELTYRFFALSNKYRHNNKSEETIDGRPRYEKNEEFERRLRDDPSNPGDTEMLVWHHLNIGYRTLRSHWYQIGEKKRFLMQAGENQPWLTKGRSDPSS